MQGVEAINFWFDGWHLLMYLAIIFFVAITIMRIRWKKVARENIKVYVFRQSGKIDKYIVPEFHGIVNVMQVLKRKGQKITKIQKGWIWKITDIHNFQDDYPGGFMSWLSVDIRAIAVNEWSVEPMAKRANVKVEYPNLLYNLMNERVTELIVSTFDELAEVKEKLQQALTKGFNPMVVYVMLGFSIVASGFAAYSAIEYNDRLTHIEERQNKINENIELIKGGLGL